MMLHSNRTIVVVIQERIAPTTTTPCDAAAAPGRVVVVEGPRIGGICDFFIEPLAQAKNTLKSNPPFLSSSWA